MKVYEDVEVWLLAFLILVCCGSEWSHSCLSFFTPEDRAAITHRVGDLVGT